MLVTLLKKSLFVKPGSCALSRVKTHDLLVTLKEYLPPATLLEYFCCGIVEATRNRAADLLKALAKSGLHRLDPRNIQGVSTLLNDQTTCKSRAECSARLHGQARWADNGATKASLSSQTVWIQDFPRATSLPLSNMQTRSFATAEYNEQGELLPLAFSLTTF
eukprot:6464719-Amphidinium_carterae.1